MKILKESFTESTGVVKSKFESVKKESYDDLSEDFKAWLMTAPDWIREKVKRAIDNGSYVDEDEILSLAEQGFKEDTVKTKDGKWTNKGKEGTHGEFDTKKQADAQRRAMFASGFKG